MDLCELPVISGVCDTVDRATATVVAAPFQFLADIVGQTASWLLQALWAVFEMTTGVDVTQDRYIKLFSLVAGIGLALTVLFAVIQATSAAMKRDAGGVGRAITGAGKAVLGTFVIVSLTATLLAITDALSVGIVQACGTTIAQMGDRMIVLLGLGGLGSLVTPGPMILLTLFLGSLIVTGTAICWFTLLIRKALILITLLLGPLVMAGLAWDAAREWIKKWAMVMVALIVSKLVMTLVFLLAWTQIGTPITSGWDAITEPLAGIAMLLIAAFAPYMVYKLLSVFGIDMYHAMSAESEAKQALNRPVPTPSGGMPKNIDKVLDAKSPGGTGGGGSPTMAGQAGTGQASARLPAGTGSSTAIAGGSSGTAGVAGGAAAAGPLAAILIAAQMIRAAATAGPRLGSAIGEAAQDQAGAAGQSGDQMPSGPGPRPNTAPLEPPRQIMPPPRPAPGPATASNPPGT